MGENQMAAAGRVISASSLFSSVRVGSWIVSRFMRTEYQGGRRAAITQQGPFSTRARPLQPPPRARPSLPWGPGQSVQAQPPAPDQAWPGMAWGPQAFQEGQAPPRPGARGWASQ